MVGVLFMKTLITGLILAALISPSALAYQKFEEYRFLGSEIRSVSAPPVEHESPGSLILTVGWDAAEPEKITIESDNSLDGCLQEIENAIGNDKRYVQIVIDISSQSINRVAVLECSSFDALFPFEN